jgi:hypothetical protein
VWADVAWSVNDFPLLMAQQDHIHWVQQIVSATQGMSLRLSAQEVCNHQRCRFGQWYYGEGTRHYSELAAFKAIERVHEEVHRVGLEALQLNADGQTEAAQRKALVLLGLRDVILAHLVELHRAVATPMEPTAVTTASTAPTAAPEAWRSTVFDGGLDL